MNYYLAKKSDYPKLLEVWEKSVRATHKFLTEQDIQDLKTKIPLYFDAVDLLVWENKGELVGFSGMHEDKLEMLFLDDRQRGQGFGRQIVSYLIENEGLNLIDVNEDNPTAVGFYKAMRFEQIGRSEYDDQGNHFPILHLKLKSN